MYGTSMEARAEYQPSQDSVAIYVIQRQPDRKIAGTYLSFNAPMEPGSCMPMTMQLPREAAQELFNDLWRAGFRPHNGEGGTAHVEAMKEHIADLRRLVFEPTRVVEPFTRHSTDPAPGSF